MQNIQPNKMQNLRQMVSEYHWLDLAESVSIAASAVGTVVGALSSQVVYAAAPLTIALSLNLANRYRLDENTEQYAKAAITDVRNVVESLYTSLPENESSHVDLQNLQKSISHLQKVTERLENKALTEDDWQMVNVRFSTLQESLERLTDSIGNSQNQPIFGQEAEENIRPEMAINPKLTESDHAELKDRIIQLEKKNHEIIKPYLQRLTHSLQEVKQAQYLGEVIKRIESLNEEVKQITVVKNEVDCLTYQLQTIAAQQAQLNQQFNLITTSQGDDNITGIEEAIAQISEDFSETKTQTTKRFKYIIRILNPLKNQINQVQNLCDTLESSVEKINDDMDKYADISVIEYLENILNQISAEIADIQNKLTELPQPFDPEEISQKLQELTALVQKQSTDPTQFLTKQDIAPLVAVIKKLQKYK